MKVFKSGPNKICGRQPLKSLKGYGLHKVDFTLSILEYFVSYFVSDALPALIRAKSIVNFQHCVKGVRLWSYSGPHFSAFSRIQSECEKMRTRITPNTGTSPSADQTF